jgi:pimeloyl-ACP methyl ester carboxylesterase
MPDAVVVPGRMFGPAAPLLMYSGDVAQERGATVHRHWWSTEPDLEDPDWVRGELTGVLDTLGGRPLMIGKSLGTRAAALAAERELPAVWLTPLLTVPQVAADLGRATAPFLLVGGTADRSWDADLAGRLTPHVLQIDDADHGMYVPGPLTASIDVLARVVVAMELFLTEIAWPR